MNNNFSKVIDIVQAGLVWFMIGIITLSIAILFLFDVLAGTGTMLFLTGGKEWQSVIISFATTGLLFSLMFIGYMLVENKNMFVKQVGGFILVVAGIIYVEDIIFDALLADILRYGTISFQGVDLIQWMFRFLLGGISTVGDALAVAMILGLPVLKSIIGKAVNQKPENSNGHKPQHHQPNQNQPIPDFLSRLPKNNNKPQPPTTRPASKPPTEEPTYHPMSYQKPKPKHNFE